MRKLLALLLFSLPLFAADYTISPASAHNSGGREVTITGDFAEWPYWVYFGTVPAKSTRRVDAHTLVAITPPHLPGVVRVRLFEYDAFVDTGLEFEFTGVPSPTAFERVLLPVFLEPVQGAFGSEFRTELLALNRGASEMQLHGIVQDCRVSCVPIFGVDEPIRLFPNDSLLNLRIHYQGTPGRFVYIDAGRTGDLDATLRVYDTSRSAENFGTGIPVVRRTEFRSEPFALLGVPLDPRFRNTLRLYSDQPTTVTVKGLGEPRRVTLTGATDLYTPAYAQISDFPSGTGVTDVIIEPDVTRPVWAFITVTNNEQQTITTIAPVR